MEAMSSSAPRLPGADLVEDGVADLAAGRRTVEALLVAMAASRLRSVGVDVPDADIAGPSHRLYELLATEDRRTAHRRYNALVGRLASFARAAESARRR